MSGPTPHRDGAIPAPPTRPLPIALALATLFGVLLLPEHPRHFGWNAFLRLPLELPLVVLALLFLPRPVARVFRVAVVLAAGTLLLLRLADIGSYLAFSRRFDPAVELHLLGDGWNLASASVGRLEAGLTVLAALCAFTLALWLVHRGLGGIERLAGVTRRALAVVASVVLVAGTAVLLVDRASADKERHTRVQADLGRDIVARTARMRRSLADQSVFVAELDRDPLADGPPPAFDALAGRDVVLVFVESYGRGFIDGERFRGPARERLATLDDVVDGAGLHVRSAWLTSPIRGGRSWLAHATFASGLTIGSQARFDRLVTSPRRSLNRLFGDAGWRTAGLMPAIRFDWPEGAWYGFDDIHDAHGLDYAGEAFGWVTMPDQYTLSAFETLVRAPTASADERPVMAEIALISSHAPWTPLTNVVPWDAVGDGSVFDGSRRFGGTPAEVWKERERVREHYALSLDYSLDVLGGYLERHGAGALFVVLGDHQPPSIVNGWDATADVPVHVIADDPALLERLPRALWSDGMLPADDLPSQPMASMRETLARSFSTAVAPDTTAGVSTLLTEPVNVPVSAVPLSGVPAPSVPTSVVPAPVVPTSGVPISRVPASGAALSAPAPVERP